ncbi:hypothetical protein NC651_018667 [Populus alba x Populus x berolinensis]|nr:hypothetical protein NC651_018667 [Populus alba x Populus x berolinensis]
MVLTLFSYHLVLFFFFPILALLSGFEHIPVHSVIGAT